MSVSMYRGQADRLTTELAQLEEKAASERARAAKERADGLRASQSITRTTSPSTAQSKMRDAQRREEQAVRHDRQAAQYSTQSASKRKALSDAQRHLADAETSDRKKLTDEADRRRRDDQRRLSDLDRARRGLTNALTPATGWQGVQETDGLEIDEEQREGPTGEGRPAPKQVSKVSRLAPETTADTSLEIAMAAALGVLSLVPVVGPVLTQVIGAAWTEGKVERLERFAVALGRDVETVADRLDTDFVRRDEFESLAEQAIDRVVLRRNDRKISGFAAAVANSATIDRPDQRTRARFLDWLDQLRPVHLEILSRVASGGAEWVRPPDVLTVGQVAASRLALALSGLEYDYLDLRELQARGLIRSVDLDAALLSVADDVRSIVTPLGRQFLGFISTGARSGTTPIGEPRPSSNLAKLADVPTGMGRRE